MNAHFVMIILACICWFLAAVPLPPAFGRYGIGWLGMFFFGLSLLIK